MEEGSEEARWSNVLWKWDLRYGHYKKVNAYTYFSVKLWSQSCFQMCYILE